MMRMGHTKIENDRHFATALFFLLFLLIPLTLGAQFPTPQGYVTDGANVLSSDQKASLEAKLDAFTRQTGNELAVVTVASLNDEPIQDVANTLFKSWGIGKKGKDNGLLFLVAPTDRKVWIEVGYGLEGTLNDARVGRLLDTWVIPRFKENDIPGGIRAGVSAVIGALNASAEETQPAEPANAPVKKEGLFSKFLKIAGVIVLIYIFIRHPWLFFMLMSMGGGGRSGGGFSGGFGGFGGGSSGGGGAGRSW